METIEIESKVLKAANIFIGKGDVRYYLNGIHLNKRGAIEASDGHTGFVSDQEQLKEMKESLIIKIHGTIPAISGTATIEFVDDKKGIITFELNQTMLAFSIIGGKFPDMGRVIPKDENQEAVETIGINADYILRLQKAAKILDKHLTAVEMKFYGKNNAMTAMIGRIECRAMVIIMPTRL